MIFREISWALAVPLKIALTMVQYSFLIKKQTKECTHTKNEIIGAVFMLWLVFALAKLCTVFCIIMQNKTKKKQK